jgi:Type II secretion system (T2SS), protein E, N-terminal domain
VPFLGKENIRTSRAEHSFLLRPASTLNASPSVGGSRLAAAQHTVCGNPECSSWMRLWKDRRRPIFEDNWGCSARCVKALVGTVVRREQGEGRNGNNPGGHSHRVPLGLVLLAQGWITHPQLHHALKVQRRAGTGRIGRWLIDECGLHEDRVTRALSVQWGCPVLQMEGFDPEKMALAIPKFLVERLGIVPLRIAAGRILYLAFEDRLDASAAFAVERMSSLKVESGLVDASELRAARQRLLDCDFVDAMHESVGETETISEKIAAVLGKMQPRASRLVRVHQFYWLRMWLESGSMTTGDGGIPTSREDVIDHIYTKGLEH